MLPLSLLSPSTDSVEVSSVTVIPFSSSVLLLPLKLVQACSSLFFSSVIAICSWG
jgi:hypothetical protein